jgi:hypothetical protein
VRMNIARKSLTDSAESSFGGKYDQAKKSILGCVFTHFLRSLPEAHRGR